MNSSIEPNRARAVRIRAYLGEPRDLKRTFRMAADADLGAFMKRAALAVLPKDEGWLLVVFSVERTSEDEQVAPFLDRLARRHMHEQDFAAALAATLDGLIGRELVARLPRRPGQKEERYTQLLGEDGAASDAPAAANGSEERPDRFAALEERVASIEEQLQELLDRLGG